MEQYLYEMKLMSIDIVKYLNKYNDMLYVNYSITSA